MIYTREEFQEALEVMKQSELVVEGYLAQLKAAAEDVSKTKIEDWVREKTSTTASSSARTRLFSALRVTGEDYIEDIDLKRLTSYSHMSPKSAALFLEMLK